MKTKLVLLFLLFLGFSARAQNTFQIQNEVTTGIVGTISVVFTDHSIQEYDIGQSGNYTFFINDKLVYSVTVGDVIGEIGETVTIQLQNGRTATMTITETIVDESRSFNSIIR